jgi:non-specific serine/threonine protein kinase/serine/threonine-protein kinase
MEYVRGEPITSYCDRVALPLRNRLELFALLCDGVQHAHQKGVIHRDLKPSNVLVTDIEDHPAPRIIDFGIAKATARRLTDTPFFTEVGGFVGTPEYMSPEQADGTQLDVDTRSDVYSLGVILYELLVGTLPHDRNALRAGGMERARRILTEEEPRKPSTQVNAGTDVASKRRSSASRLTAAVRGDLDWIALKALEKERARRYPTANALAMDVRRHLNDEPVSASPPSTAYRMSKFVRRHSVAVGATATILLALLAFVGVLLIQARRLAIERDRASLEAATATQVTQFLVDLFNISDPGEARGNALTAREALDKGATQLESTLGGQPVVRARLGAAIGTVYTNLGLYSLARPLLEGVVDASRKTLGAEHPDTIAAVNALATVFWYQRDYSKAIEFYDMVFTARRASLGDSHRATLRAKFDLSSAYQGAMRLPEAERLLRETLAQQRSAFGDDDPDTLSSVNNLQGLYFQMKRYDDALPIAREVLERQTKLLADDHPSQLLSMHNLGAILLELKRFDEAEPLLRASLDGRRRVLGAHHARTLTTWERYARLLNEKGNAEEARLAYQGILTEIGDDQQPPYPTLTKNALENLVALSAALGDGRAAASWTRQLDQLTR